VSVLLYFNGIVANLDNVLDARYLIAIAGMLLGNSLRGTIIGVGVFYRGVKRDGNRYFYSLASGATRYEAMAPFFRRGMTSALKPALANMATMGLVFLPGMMTGQILAGMSPLIAIEYQIAIMLAILGSVSVTLFILTRFGYLTFFNKWSQLEENIGDSRR